MTRWSWLATVAALLLVSPLPARAGVVGDSLAPSTTPLAGYGYGASYWGPIPPPADSSLAQLRNNSLPLWESALIWPYRVAVSPLWLLSKGIGAAINIGATSEFLAKLARAPSHLPAPSGSRIGVSFQAGGIGGIGGGVSLRHDSLYAPGNKLFINLSTTNKENTKTTLGLLFGAGSANQIEIGLGRRVRPNARFFGIGPGSEETDESLYRREQAWVGVEYRRGLGENLFLDGDVLFSTVRASTAELEDLDDDERLLQDVFAGDLPIGFNSRNEGVGFGLSLVHNTVPDIGRAGGGGIRRIKAFYMTSVDEQDFSFWNYRVDVQQFIPLWYSNRSLALRSYLSWIDPRGSDPLPFSRLIYNDDPDLFRGFKDFRWRDRGFTALSAEYRWPFWADQTVDGRGIDIYLLSDVGQVFGEFDDIALRNLQFSYGVGFRAVTKERFFFRFEYARSDEGAVVWLVGTQVFQFSLDRLLGGKDQDPSR